MSLRGRLLLAVGAVALIALVSADVATYSSLKNFLYDRVDQSLDSTHVPLEQAFGGGGTRGGFQRGGGAPDLGRFAPGTFVEIRSSDDSVAFVTPANVRGGQQYTPDVADHIDLRADSGNGGSGDAHTYFTVDAAEAGGPQFRVRASTLPTGDQLLIAVPLSLGVAIYLTEFAPAALRQPVAFVIGLLAAIPSVVYGLWGIFVLIPFLKSSVFPFLRDTLGFLPFFQGTIYGPSMLAAGIILAIMVMPYIMSVAREVLLAVPGAQREAALALGATRWEAVTSAVVPYARSGIIGAVILGLGRALGETIAVTMLIGNRHEIAASLFAPGYTMAAAIANEFAEAVGDIHLSSLAYVALVLFAVTVLVNAGARLLIWRVARGSGAGSSAL
jgi:phosphate transport system permease protein